MRIISGTARGRQLTTPPQKDNSIRPTADRAREALFNIIGVGVKNCQVLDLFAGTGALGLEAFSRGAQHVVLVDKNPLSLAIIKKNISLFSGAKEEQNIIVIKDDLYHPNFLKKLPDNISRQFDLIFADPPYGKDFSLPILQYVNDNNVLRNDGTIIIEERHDIVLPEQLSRLKRFDSRKYGETGFSFYSFQM